MNKPKYHKLFITLIFFMNYGRSFSLQTIQKDSSNLKVTHFKEAIADRYKGSDFNYDSHDTGGINLLQTILKKFFGWIGDIFGIDIDFINYRTLELIVYGFLAVASVYLLIKFFTQTSISAVFKTENKDIDSFKYVEENIKDVNFDTLIAEAIKENNYRLATRYLYLKSLKLLTQKNVIDWHYDKTNTDYINEIKDETTKSIFKRISYIYDYVWYGEFPIDLNSYQKNQSDFDKLKTL